jgi:hypothetical protein
LYRPEAEAIIRHFFGRAGSGIGVQDVNTKASREHCQSGPSAPLDTGSGCAMPIAMAAATATSVITAMDAATGLIRRKLEVIVCAPHQPAANIGAGYVFLCERGHMEGPFFG